MAIHHRAVPVGAARDGDDGIMAQETQPSLGPVTDSSREAGVSLQKGGQDKNPEENES